jgi:hypothetical protein
MLTLDAPAQDRDLDIKERILRAIQGIRYGSVEIVIHDSRIVQIERREKIRFDADGRNKD